MTSRAPTQAAAGGVVKEAPAAVGGWLAAAREDPTTGLVCWPDFYAAWPAVALADLRRGHSIGVAIGDVDDLTGYVETANTRDPNCWGHLAGNQFMADAGRATRTWLTGQSWSRACAATFGGDEIVLAARIESAAQFLTEITDLHDQLNTSLPRTISWAVTWLDPSHVLTSSEDGQRLWLAAEGLGRLDRSLFQAKKNRTTKRSFLTVVEPRKPS